MKPKRILSLALALAMVVGMVPGTALGANADDPKTTTITQETTTGGTLTMTLTIAPKSLEGATVTLDKTQLTYNGSEQTVNVSEVKLNDKTLTANDYEVTSGNKGTNVGEYTLTITGKGNYTGTATATWKIVAKDMAASAENVTATYDGQPHGLTVNVTDPASGATIKYGTTAENCTQDTSPTITNVTDSPITVYYKVTAANYNDKTGSATVTINKANQTAPAAPTMASNTVNSVTLNTITNGEYSKDGISWQESPTFTGLTMNTEYTFYQRLKGDANHNASPDSPAANISTSNHAHNWDYQADGASITATCGNTDGGHTGSTTATLTINAPALTTYGGQESAEATITGSIDGVTTPTVVYKKDNDTLNAAPTDAGTYTASITLDGQTASVEYTISKANSTVTAPTANTLTYNGTDQALVTGGRSTDGQVQYSLSEIGTYGTAIPSKKDAGDYTVWYKVVGDSNHNDIAPAKVDVTIVQKEVGLNWGENSFTYDGQAHAPTASATGVESGDTCTVTVTGEQTNAGENYTATASSLSNSNYKLPSAITQAFSIAKKNVTITGLSASSKTYDGNANATVTGTAVIDGKINGDNVSVSAGSAAFVNKNAGEDKTVTFSGYILSGTDAGNYNLTAQPESVTANITKKDVTITGLSAESKTYDGNASATVTGTAAIDGKIDGDTVSVTAGSAAFADKNVGSAKTVSFSGYSLSGTDAGNYNLTAQPESVTANITKKDVTITGLGAENKTYDGNANAVVTGTAVISGEVVGDDVSVTAGSAAFADKNAGNAKTVSFSGYSLSGADAGNYNLTAQPESVQANISQASITIAADNKSTSYKQDIAPLTYSIAEGELKNSDKLDSLKINVSTTATKDSPVNTYPITLEQGDGSNPNYNVTLTPGTYTINEADATISDKPYSGIYDGKEHSITVEVKDTPHNILDLIAALFGADNKAEATVYYSTESVEKAQADKNTTNPVFKDVGTYTVYYAVEFGGNYKADPVTGSQTVSITKAPLTITAKDAEISYNEEAVNSGVTYEGFAEGEDESVLNGELSYAYNYKQGDNSGEYTITPSGLTSDNYEITFVDGKLTVKALGDPTLEVTTEGEDKRLDIVLDQESAEKLLTKDELKDYNNGVSATVYVLVDELSASDVPAADKKLAEEFMKDGKIGQYLDLTLWVQVGDNDPRQITNAASDVTLKIAIPDALKVNGSDVERTFYLIRVHDGKATSLVSTTGDTLEADSRLFSTYAIGYKDKTVKDGTKKTDTKKTDTTKKTTTKTSGKSPKTGDAAMLGLWVTMAGASATGLGALALTGKRRKNNRRDNRTAGRRRNR